MPHYVTSNVAAAVDSGLKKESPAAPDFWYHVALVGRRRGLFPWITCRPESKLMINMGKLNLRLFYSRMYMHPVLSPKWLSFSACYRPIHYVLPSIRYKTRL